MKSVRRDASLGVKLWIVASVILMFGSIGVGNPNWHDALRVLGELSMMASVWVGLRQSQSGSSNRAA